MNRTGKILTGALLFVAGVWLGSWLLHTGPEWAVMANFTTALLVCAAGVVLAMLGAEAP